MGGYSCQCPSCGTNATSGAIATAGRYPDVFGRCPTCWHWIDPVTYERLTKKNEHLLSKQEKEHKYDEQVLIEYVETGKPAKNIKYKLVDHKTNKVLKEGRTDEKGKAERISTEKSEAVDVFVFRLNEDREEVEKNISNFWTNDRKDSLAVVKMNQGRIFFDIRYVNPVKDPAESFIKAAETIKKKKRGYVDKYRGDVWWSFDVTTECDIKTKWQELYDLQQEADMEVEEGHILTHATITGKSGLEFATIGCSEDGTLALHEIAKLPQLKWTKTSTLWLYGCRTGLPDPKNDGKRIADVFFERQISVRVVKGQKGYGYFSYESNFYQKIIDYKEDPSDIYLWAFDRMLNTGIVKGSISKIHQELGVDVDFGSGRKIPEYTVTRVR